VSLLIYQCRAVVSRPPFIGERKSFVLVFIPWQRSNFGIENKVGPGSEMTVVEMVESIGRIW
jgi:hypothetical protein